MQRLRSIAWFFAFAASVAVHSAPTRSQPTEAATAHSGTTDFWYIVSGSAADNAGHSVVEGLVVPSSVAPTVQASAVGSVIAWRRADGTRQSFVVRGPTAIAPERGPIDGTIFVPFRGARIFEYDPRSCCTCASWQNSEESIDALSCVSGCTGCGCEGCICSPTFPCPENPEGTTTLRAHDDANFSLIIDKAPAMGGITLVRRGGGAVRFEGPRVHARAADRDLVIEDPSAILIPGAVSAGSKTRHDSALFAWSSPSASVILEQPRSMPPPTFDHGTIRLDSVSEQGGSISAGYPAIAPVSDRCVACGTHPNSTADLDIYECVPGFSTCYRCVSWECLTPGS